MTIEEMLKKFRMQFGGGGFGTTDIFQQVEDFFGTNIAALLEEKVQRIQYNKDKTREVYGTFKYDEPYDEAIAIIRGDTIGK